MHTAPLYGMHIWHGTVWHGTVWHGMVECYAEKKEEKVYKHTHTDTSTQCTSQAAYLGELSVRARVSQHQYVSKTYCHNCIQTRQPNSLM